MSTIVNIAKAVEILRNGGLVGMPTETVYGLGADASNSMAVGKIFAAKERPLNHPLIVHIASLTQLEQWAQSITPQVLKLAEAFWPGPLTMILNKQPQVLDLVTGGQGTVGLRIPRHPVAQELLRIFGGGIAAPSANKFTQISATTKSAVEEELGEAVDLVLEGGSCEVGLESTIIDMTSDPTILRPGMISAADIGEVLGCEVQQLAKSPIQVPGMHPRHYAPQTKTRLIETQNLPMMFKNLSDNRQSIVALTWSDIALANVEQIKMPNEPAAYAREVYQILRALDKKGYQQIVVENVPNDESWAAIRDRLSKASHRKG